MKLTLHIWRQQSRDSAGDMVTYEVEGISPSMSFLEMLDHLNEQLVAKSQEPVAFDHDCREGICGTCSLMINGVAHGPQAGTTACQLHMRAFKDGDVIYIEPWRAKAFPILRDLVTDRGSFDRIIASGGFVSVATGGVPDANGIPIPKDTIEESMDAATCIGCGACVAACKNASAMLFVAAKASHLAVLPQGALERNRRALAMVKQASSEGFGSCTNTNDCQAVCPKEISVDHIARLNRDFLRASLKEKPL